MNDLLNIGIAYKAKAIDEVVDLILARHGLHRHSCSCRNNDHGCPARLRPPGRHADWLARPEPAHGRSRQMEEDADRQPTNTSGSEYDKARHSRRLRLLSGRVADLVVAQWFPQLSTTE